MHILRAPVLLIKEFVFWALGFFIKRQTKPVSFDFPSSLFGRYQLLLFVGLLAVSRSFSFSSASPNRFMSCLKFFRRNRPSACVRFFFVGSPAFGRAFGNTAAAAAFDSPAL